MKTVVINLLYCIKGRAFQMLWISLVVYSFYDTFIYYQEAPQFYHLRKMLGTGLYISRGTASVLNISCALVLLPLCKRLNKLLYRMLSKIWPGLFFFWLERAKSFHITVAITLVLFAVIHSISHFANLCNFSRYYNDEIKDINFANYKNENPMSLLLSQPGLTGVAMLIITSLMAMTSLRTVRRKCYNAFWYTHHLYLPFMMLLIVHPLSGALKEQVLKVEDGMVAGSGYMNHDNVTISTEFVPIQSKLGGAVEISPRALVVLKPALKVGLNLNENLKESSFSIPT
ncbi:hypothetical protein JYU34_007224 [Plutella xylostella]|uniref:Ferric oxidoreductase domain-containing protein n=1 Tax=Plutella xylostella TaxID=51655 RepID=A0ABQ7QPW5_PLUXY|nr:hypothetical protein JYU34_007224 [Plutella xylostella]